MSHIPVPQNTSPPNEPAIIAYLNILQSTISRMGMNSLYCKILCGTILAALGAVSGLKGHSFFLTATFPLIICSWADARYLSLERVYREKYDKTVEKYYRTPGNDDAPELFDMKPGNKYKSTDSQKKSFKSWSVWPVYFVLLVYMLVIAFFKNS